MKFIKLCIFCVFMTSIFSANADEKGLKHFYDSWKTKYLKKSKLVEGGSYVDYQNNETTVSEAHGYGMLITAYAKFDEDAHTEFKRLNLFREKMPSNVDSRLMRWKINDNKNSETGCATDGDLDMAYALILAYDRWKIEEYKKQALKILDGIKKSLIREDHSLRRGEWDIYQHAVRFSDIMPGHFIAFLKFTADTIWQKVIDKHYHILNDTISKDGIFPDFVGALDKVTWVRQPKAYTQDFSESEFDGDMYYNSCRVPWRLAAAAIEYKDPKAMYLLTKFNSGIGNVGFEKFYPGYSYTSGKPIRTDYKETSFSAPHMCSLKVNQQDKKFTYSYNKIVSTFSGYYYPDSISLLCLMLVTNNTHKH